jgi:cytidine deaminase
MDWETLIAAAAEARGRARAILTGYSVGAAILYDDEVVVAGCNLEFDLAGLSLCAERVAVACGVARGLGPPRALAVVTTDSPPAAPCGVCRQMLVELLPAGDDLPILLANPAGERREFTLLEIYPHSFRRSRH